MNFWSLLLILISLTAFVAGQLILKKAMAYSVVNGMRSRRFITLCGIGTFLMAIYFFLMLGLLQRFELSYLYPFEGLTVIIICVAAAVTLREKLTFQLTLGALLITAGVILVSVS